MINGDTDKDTTPFDPTAPGPDLTSPELSELFVDWKTNMYKTRDFKTMNEEEKGKINVDEVLSFYLSQLAAKVNPSFYLIVLRFVIGFRECLNKYGWEKKAENDETLSQKYAEKWQTDPPVVVPPPEDVMSKATELKAKSGGLDYSTINSAEHAPEICNELVTIFIQD